ncbi:type III secretion system export apparatus subunit SctR [Paraburkholderia sediminicola]|uniref:type III secretion system export apparatus subunit SctR n=1 Tax=Paraburkholderia sediminicola TaxID=458836 RepID=UPI0038BDD52D
MQFLDHPVELIVILFGLSLLPLFMVIGTCFLKISIVLSMLRSAIGLPQVPPNVAIYALSLILTAFVMAPVASQVSKNLTESPPDLSSPNAIANIDQKLYQPYREFLTKQVDAKQVHFFLDIGHSIWKQDFADQLNDQSLIVLMPAFAMSEINRAFKIVIILYLPFLVIDILVTNILLSLGMMMVSPITIALPIKILLFVVVDGWSKLLFQLVMSYK